jgi:predicted nicotinamide N-methyase
MVKAGYCVFAVLIKRHLLGATYLARHIETTAATHVTGRRVLEVGSGAGLCGIVAAAVG